MRTTITINDKLFGLLNAAAETDESISQFVEDLLNIRCLRILKTSKMPKSVIMNRIILSMI